MPSKVARIDRGFAGVRSTKPLKNQTQLTLN